MWPIRIVDASGKGGILRDLRYALPEARRPGGLFGSHYAEVEGLIRAFLCDDCGLVRLYGVPSGWDDESTDSSRT
jgi:hypothetical protein